MTDHGIAFIINPGSGPVGGATRADADAAIGQFVADLSLGVTTEFVNECQDVRYDHATRAIVETGPDGRFEYILRLGERRSEIQMPGLPIERVRYLGDGGQNIWDFPRLYVDGSSWVWCYAINSARSMLLGENEDE